MDTLIFNNNNYQFRFQFNEFLLQAALSYVNEDDNSTSLFCAGTIISEEFILTTAHCTRNRANKVIEVRVGSVSWFIMNIHFVISLISINLQESLVDNSEELAKIYKIEVRIDFE